MEICAGRVTTACLPAVWSNKCQGESKRKWENRQARWHLWKPLTTTSLRAQPGERALGIFHSPDDRIGRAAVGFTTGDAGESLRQGFPTAAQEEEEEEKVFSSLHLLLEPRET